MQYNVCVYICVCVCVYVYICNTSIIAHEINKL